MRPFTLKSVSEHSTILVAVHGPDGPGISAGLMAVLADAGVEVYDVEQIVVRGRLTLNVLMVCRGNGRPSGTFSSSAGSAASTSISRRSTIRLPQPGPCRS
jgi:predicted amino acid-binding ACT domain protein